MVALVDLRKAIDIAVRVRISIQCKIMRFAFVFAPLDATTRGPHSPRTVGDFVQEYPFVCKY